MNYNCSFIFIAPWIQRTNGNCSSVNICFYPPFPLLLFISFFDVDTIKPLVHSLPEMNQNSACRSTLEFSTVVISWKGLELEDRSFSYLSLQRGKRGRYNLLNLLLHSLGLENGFCFFNWNQKLSIARKVAIGYQENILFERSMRKIEFT